MNTLTEQLNLTTDLSVVPAHAVVINTRRDVNILDTLMLYFAENDIVSSVYDDIDVLNTSDLIQEYKNGVVKEYDQMAFWID